MLFKFQYVIQLLLLISICACSQIKSYFPDKSKNYQLAKQIPALQMPADFLTPSKQAMTNTVKTPANTPTNPDNSDNSDKPVNPPSANTVKLTYLTDTAHIHIRLKDNENGMSRVWRLTEKALLRHAIEIVGRDEASGVYFVQYDADFKKITDGSLWDEVIFFFAPNPAQEKEFNIKLSTHEYGIKIIIINNHQTSSAQSASLSQAHSLKLLNILYQAIKQDLTSE